MLPFQKTTLYQESLINANKILQIFIGVDNFLEKKVETEILDLISNLAKAFTTQGEKEKLFLNKALNNLVSIAAFSDFAELNKKISVKEKNEIVTHLNLMQEKISYFKKFQKKILILSAKMGQGHMSAAKAISEAIEFKYGYDYNVEIVDFTEVLSSLINLVTKKSYESTVKFAPSIYKFFYESTDKTNFIKILNQLNYPFVLSKVKKFFEEKEPDIVISTFPIWNYLASNIWKKTHNDAKFISIITDSITVHNSWVFANTDFHIVANNDTAESLLKLSVEKEKIKVLGFPIRLSFLKECRKEKMLKELNLNEKNFTVLFLPTSQNQSKNLNILKELMELGPNINIIIITGRDSKVKPKLENYIIKKKNKNIYIVGWTERMSDFIKTADVVVTKAGGATVMECIAAFKPMVITSIIPGQEEGNAELIKKYRLGIIANSPRVSIRESIDYIHKNYQTFQNNVKKTSNPEGALKIAEFIAEVLK